jgi:hypothetical protein
VVKGESEHIRMKNYKIIWNTRGMTSIKGNDIRECARIYIYIYICFYLLMMSSNSRLTPLKDKNNPE